MAPRRSLAFDADLLRGTDDEDEEDAVPPPRRLSAKARGKRPAREVEAGEEDVAPAEPAKRAYFAPVVVAEGAGRSTRNRAQPNGATTASGSGSASTSSSRKAKPAAVAPNRQLSRATAADKPMSRSLKGKRAEVAAPRVPRSHFCLI